MPAYFCQRPLQPQAPQYPMEAALDPFLAALFGAAPSQGSSAHTPKTTPKPTPRQPHRACRSFSPNFDVFETAEAFHLEGALPGLSNKEAVDIEFSDDRTMLVRGRIERSAPKAAVKQQSQEQNQIEEKKPDEETPVEEKRRSLNPTVEDTDDEDDAYSIVHTPSHSSTTSATSQSSQKKEVAVEKKEEAPNPQRKTWVSERTYGSFQRTFSFPTPVDLENVTASLDAGILSIIVPKVVFQGTRKIEIE